MKVIVECDGGSRGNPGPAGFGCVVWSADHGTLLAEHKQAIGITTNNVAEYRALIAGLEEARRLGAAEVAVAADSKLIIEQMSGRWKVKHPDMAELHQQARALASTFDAVTYEWIPRERNAHADRLANEAMDAAAGGGATIADPPAGAVAVPPATWTGNQGAPTRMLLLRHGQTELSRQRRYSGRGNPELTETGRAQADAAARYLAGRGGVEAVVTSPLQRSYDTAAAAAKALGLEVRVDDDLIETDFGAWEGLTFREAAERDPDLHLQWLRNTSLRPPGGESFDDVQQRVQRARNRIIAEHGGGTV
ncbi:MAG TPA: bifunctional RNase H/acid phosphatase, partial [Mycobacterium sp.]|nr:bifunctional RNase H/acid phosphatase [Mycobacterium sp.]